MLGLKHNVNLLVDYDADWPLLFLDEQRRIAEALGDVAKGIEHYGSTAVLGMRSKRSSTSWSESIRLRTGRSG
jgi:GrpB-like predicted nucleotidyltransferase (UPF0157 family)